MTFDISSLTKAPTSALVVWGLVVGATGLGIYGMVPKPAPANLNRQVRAYDYAFARRNLERIGAALQLYRTEYGVRPIAERQTYSDAGLPRYISTRMKVAGHPWSITRDDLRGFGERQGSAQLGSNFTEIVGTIHDYRAKTPPQMTDIYARRGESLPILIDLCPKEPQFRTDRTAPFKVLVLRLNGTVDEVMWDPTDQSRTAQSILENL